MSQSQSTVMKIYRSVIDDVITGVRDAFLDEGVDEQVLQELKQLWESKLLTSKTVEVNPDPPEPHPPQFGTRDNRNNIALKSMRPLPASHMMNMYTHGVPQHAQHTSHAPQHQTAAGHGAMAGQASAPAPAPAQAQPQPTAPQSQLQPQGHAHGQMQATHTVIVTDPNKQVPIQITLPAQGGGDPRVLTIQVPAMALQGNQLQQVLTGPVISATMALPPHLASSLLQQHVTAALQGAATSGAAAAALVQQSTPTGAVRQLDGADDMSDDDKVDNGKEQATMRAAGTVRQSANVSDRSEGCEDQMVAALLAGAVGKRPGAVWQLDGAGDTSDDDEDEEEEEEIDEDEDNEDKEEEENEEDNLEGQEEEPLNSGDDVSDEDPSDLFDTDNVVVCQYDKITRSRNKWKFYLKDGIMNLNGKDFVFQKASGDAEW